MTFIPSYRYFQATLYPLLFAMCMLLCAFRPVKPTFSATEQQQISVPTPNLFKTQSSIEIDFSQIEESAFSFPLPVGKATLLPNKLGMEIETTAGDAVKAMFKGTVRLSKFIAGHGNVVVVRHENGLETVYARNAQNLVSVGDEVTPGQTLAIVGGQNKRTFCNVSIMINGSRINPSTLIDIKSHRLRKQTVIATRSGKRIRVQVKNNQQSAQNTTASTNSPQKAPTNKAAVETKDADKTLDLAQLTEQQWAYPLPGAHVISPYGGRRRHAGVDIKTKPNDKILAAFDGIVTQSGPYFGYGNFIVIKHPNGLETRYSHQSKNFVKKGDRVKAGDVIGLTGRTGRATTEHLHFEVSFQGKRINPELIFNHATRMLKKVTLFLLNGRVSSK